MVGFRFLRLNYAPNGASRVVVKQNQEVRRFEPDLHFGESVNFVIFVTFVASW